MDLGVVLWDGGKEAEALPPKFYHEQARKLLEVVVQVQLHFIFMYEQ